jgi:hypothetical protein
VEFELLFELKFEQKKGTSLVKLVLSRRKSRLRAERLSVPVIYFGYLAWFHSDLASISSLFVPAYGVNPLGTCLPPSLGGVSGIVPGVLVCSFLLTLFFVMVSK